MLRLVELALFLAPFAAFAIWRFMAMERGPSIQLVAVTACVVILLIGAMIWLSQEAALPPGTTYAPAQLENGRVIPGHAAPR
jgi:hypothetical protein